MNFWVHNLSGHKDHLGTKFFVRISNISRQYSTYQGVRFSSDLDRLCDCIIQEIHYSLSTG